jgi:hypothetical protein
MTASPPLLAGIGALARAGAIVIKKLLNRKPLKLKPEYITRAEFHQGMDSILDRVAAGYLVLADKIEASHNELLTGLNRLAQTVERRLNRFDTAVARLDERTSPPNH